MEKKDYYVGLDVGTDSVGWAVTDDKYKLQKARGQDLWGSYLFDPAQTAVERRMFRTARRRTARVRARILLLQSLFAEEIAKVDPTFFIRMNDSKLQREDKDERITTKYLFFGDEGYTDKTFYAQYPTIYHLRLALMRGEIRDVRLLYLAVHHIIKNRGHFLFEGQSFNAGGTDNAKAALRHINAWLEDMEADTFVLEHIDECLAIIKSRDLNKTAKKSKLKELFGIGKNKSLLAAITLMIGGQADLVVLYGLEDAESMKFTFDNANFDDSIMPQIEKTVGVDSAELVRLLKSIYDWAILSNILSGRQYISEAKVAAYTKHHDDLATLKTYVRRNCPEKYAQVFRHVAGLANYAAYIGMDKQHGYEKASKEDFYAFLKKTVGITDADILSEIEKGTFLPKQVTISNGVVPYQLHLTELQAILSNAERSFPWLKAQSDGMSVSDKIVALMTFRIPYYVGPLNTASRFSWVCKREGHERTKITPWNFDTVVDRDASEERFIGNMTCKCSYLPGRDVLPFCSLLYSEFRFLNEVNNLKVFGEKNEAARQAIIAYAHRSKRLTLKNLCSLLIKEGIIPPKSTAEQVFSGVDGDIKNNLASYIDIRTIIGDLVDTNSEMAEDIIRYATVMSDRERLIARIKRTYGHILSVQQTKELASLHFAEWGRFSRELLTDICSDKIVHSDTGEPLNIIQAMRETGLNFMQLMSNTYGYPAVVADYNAELRDSTDITYRSVKELYCSPSVKRAIWRSVVLVKEIVKIRGGAPKKLFIEMARGATEEQKHKRTIPRKQQLMLLYNSIQDDKREWVQEIENTADGRFNSDKILLYYQQMGRCMYTGEPINLADLVAANTYDIDHIYPQSKIKDDSLDNRVLVRKQSNMQKTNIYPLPEEVRSKMLPFWQMLKARKLISERKYARLVRNTPLTMEELADFVERQIVETRQSTKALAEILSRMLPDTEIVYAKARNAAEFKRDNGLIKVRELNDFHHAKDAFINIVVGNVLNTKYSHNPLVYFRTHSESDCNLTHLFDNVVPGAWRPEYRADISRTYAKNTCVVVTFSSEGTGSLFNATIKTAGTNDRLIPLKANGKLSDTAKYGGYDTASTGYFMLVRSLGKRSAPMLSLERVPIMVDRIIGTDTTALVRYCEEKLGLMKPEVLISRIKINTLFEIDGSLAYIRGVTGNRILWCNANQLILDTQSTRYLKNITSYFDGLKKLGRAVPVDEKYDRINAAENLRLYNTLISKLSLPVYAGLSIAGQIPFLIDQRLQFIALSLTDQAKLLIQILHLMQCNSVLSDFSSIGGGANAGKILTNKVITDCNIRIHHISPTGYYRDTIDVSEML